jgi:flagellar biosynthetic protein FliR
MLAQYLPAEILGFMLVFARVGSTVMLLPGIGEAYVPPQVRLSVALALAFVLYPLVRGGLPGVPDMPLEIFTLIAGEIVLGVFLGTVTRFLITSLHIAGTVIAFQSSLAYAQTVDPNQGTQGALVSALLTLFGVVLIFVTGMHVVMIGAIHDSYQLFPPGGSPPSGDFAQMAVNLMADSFSMGMRMSTPFIVYGLVFYIGLGLLQRLIPQVQLFFIAMPAQLILAMLVLMLVLTAILMFFVENFEDNMTKFLVPG